MKLLKLIDTRCVLTKT